MQKNTCTNKRLIRNDPKSKYSTKIALIITNIIRLIITGTKTNKQLAKQRTARYLLNIEGHVLLLLGLDMYLFVLVHG